jgi:hypothetical protein
MRKFAVKLDPSMIPKKSRPLAPWVSTRPKVWSVFSDLVE